MRSAKKVTNDACLAWLGLACKEKSFNCNSCFSFRFNPKSQKNEKKERKNEQKCERGATRQMIRNKSYFQNKPSGKKEQTETKLKSSFCFESIAIKSLFLSFRKNNFILLLIVKVKNLLALVEKPLSQTGHLKGLSLVWDR